jgi:hypothetical protein
VFSSLFIMPVVVIAGLPFHAGPAARSLGDSFAWLRAILRLFAAPGGLALAATCVVLLGLLASGLPMLLGIRAFRHLET